MTFTSSPLLLFRQFVFRLIATASLTALAVGGLFWLGLGSTASTVGIAALALASCAGYVAVKGRVRVVVTDDEVAIFRPCEEERRFSRRRYVFSSRVVSHSVNLVPVETERILIASAENESEEIVLANLAKRPFDTLMAMLLRDRHVAEPPATAAAPDAGAETLFIVPKEAMLGDFRRLIIIFTVAGLALSVGLIGFVGYFATTANRTVPMLPMLGKAVGMCFLMFAGLGVPVLMTYKKRERGMPSRVRIDADAVEIGDERFGFGEIRRVVATPPDYGMGEFIATRAVTVWTDRGKTPFNFGVRVAGGVWKTSFADYGEMCEALERAAVRHGFEFVYDL